MFSRQLLGIHSQVLKANATRSLKYTSLHRSFASFSGFKEAVSENEIKELVKGTDPCIFYYTAQWCGPCKRIGPAVIALTKQYPNSRVLKIDVDKFPEAAENDSINAVPTFILRKPNNQEEIIQGADFAGVEKLISNM